MSILPLKKRKLAAALLCAAACMAATEISEPQEAPRDGGAQVAPQGAEASAEGGAAAEADAYSISEYKTLLSAYEGEWRGEVRARAAEGSTLYPSGTAPRAGKTVSAAMSCVLKTAADGSWELEALARYGDGVREKTERARIFLRGGVLYSEISREGAPSALYRGARNGEKIVWKKADFPDGEPASVEWFERGGGITRLRTQSEQTIVGAQGALHIVLEGEFRKQGGRPERIEQHGRKSSLL